MTQFIVINESNINPIKKEITELEDTFSKVKIVAHPKGESEDVKMAINFYNEEMVNRKLSLEMQIRDKRDSIKQYEN